MNLGGKVTGTRGVTGVLAVGGREYKQRLNKFRTPRLKLH